MKMIFNGECGKFNPLLLECLLDIKDALIKNALIKNDKNEIK